MTTLNPNSHPTHPHPPTCSCPQALKSAHAGYGSWKLQTPIHYHPSPSSHGLGSHTYPYPFKDNKIPGLFHFTPTHPNINSNSITTKVIGAIITCPYCNKVLIGVDTDTLIQ